MWRPTCRASRADPLKLKQVLLNLITNAIKFSHAGDRVLRRARRWNRTGCISVAVRSRHRHGRAEIKTAVTRFGQVASAWSRKHPGTGLGLPLAIGLVELHDGRLTIDSIKGKGTTVTIVLPMSRLVRSGAVVGA